MSVSVAVEKVLLLLSLTCKLVGCPGGTVFSVVVVCGMRKRMATSLRRKGRRRRAASKAVISAARASCSRLGQAWTRRAIWFADRGHRAGSKRWRSVAPWLPTIVLKYESRKRLLLFWLLFDGECGEAGETARAAIADAAVVVGGAMVLVDVLSIRGGVTVVDDGPADGRGLLS